MKKIFLSLFFNNFDVNPVLRISKKRPSEDGLNSFVRSSPLYQIGSDFVFNEIEKEFSGSIILLYSIQPLSLYNQLIKNGTVISKSVKIYLSHGFSSLVLFVSNSSLEIDKLKLEEEFIGYETWHIENNIVTNSKNNLPDFYCNKNIEIDTNKLNIEEQFIFSDIVSSLNLAYAYAEVFLTVYIPVLEEVKRKVLDFYNRSLFLNEKIDFVSFSIKTKEVNVNKEGYSESLLMYYKDILKNNSIEQVFIKDEIVQIASVLKISNSQLFGSIPVLKYGMYQSGKNSLLGMGHHVVGFLSVYLHIRDCFNDVDFEKAFEVTYSKIPSPSFLLKLEEDSYIKWYSKFIDANGLDDFIENRDKNSTHLVVCFSNRQGFRLTKHSVSAAMQSLYLSYLPSFTLNTLTHELLHAHVRSEIMVEMYPIVETENGGLLNKESFSKYKKIFSVENNYNYTLKEFIQINFLLMAGMLKENLSSGGKEHKVKKTYDEAVLYKTLKIWYKEIEEIIVHILDLLYFYNSDVNLYTKAIWISWLSLPFSVNNLEDYILRTICSITATEKNVDRLKRFDWAIDILKRQLNDIKAINFVNSSYVDIVLSHLDNENIINKIRYRYTNAFVNLVDITAKFLFSSGLKSRLNQDSNLIETEGLGFSYNLNIDDCEDRTIESPIGLINEINRLNIFDTKNLNSLENNEIERRSMWMNSLIVTSLKKYKNGG